MSRRSCAWFSFIAVLTFAPPVRAQDMYRPDGWSITDAPFAYRLAADSAVKHNGARALRAFSIVPNYRGVMSIGQRIKADDYRGKRVRFSIWVRTENMMKGTFKYGAGNGEIFTWAGAAVSLQVQGAKGLAAQYSTLQDAVSGTTDWRRESVVLDVPGDAVGISFQMRMNGGGTMWLDDASFEVVDAKKVPASAPPSSASKASLSRVTDENARYANAPTGWVNLDFER